MATADTASYVSRAQRAGTVAVQADQHGDQNLAVQAYLAAADALMALVKITPEGEIKEGYRRTLNSYISRVEKLRGKTATDAVVASRKARVQAANKFEAAILDEVVDKSPGVRWADVAGADSAKGALYEAVVLPMLRPDMFEGIRQPDRGVLLFGPPGTGKTLLAKAVATEGRATFFNISASVLTSKYLGDGEKMVRALFAVARKMAPAIIFIDEVDALLGRRSDGEHDATRRLKTEFLVHMDGAGTHDADRVLVLAATNLPQSLDDAVIRRMPARVYVGLPDATARARLISRALSTVGPLTARDANAAAALTEGYSGSDLAALCREAALAPIRELGPAVATAAKDAVRPVSLADLRDAAARRRPSVPPASLRDIEAWNAQFGSPGSPAAIEAVRRAMEAADAPPSAPTLRQTSSNPEPAVQGRWEEAAGVGSSPERPQETVPAAQPSWISRMFSPG